MFQPQFRNVLKATNNSLYPFFQDFPEFEVLEINKFLFSLANLKFSFFLQISNLEIPFYRIPILPGKISKPLSFRLEIESHFTEIPFYREHTVVRTTKDSTHHNTEILWSKMFEFAGFAHANQPNVKLFATTILLQLVLSTQHHLIENEKGYWLSVPKTDDATEYS